MAKNLRIGLISKDWALEFNSKGFEIVEQGSSILGDSTYIHVAQDKSGINISIFLEPARKKNSNIIDCRDFYWNRAQADPRPKENILMKEMENMAIIEYITPEHGGMKIDHKNINAYMVKDDTWIDVHVSKIHFKEKELKNFYSLLNSVKFVKKDVNLSFALFIAATQEYDEGNYPEAIKYYYNLIQQELKNEKFTIPIHLLRISVDNAGMALGISGNLELAKETFELGLFIDPEYPLFYYNLACTYAEMDDLENTLINLDLCLKNEEHLIPGESLPDPRLDESFQRFMENEQFKTVLNKYSSVLS